MRGPARTIELDAALADARRSGAIGPGPLAEHLHQALGYLAAGLVPPAARVFDLGSGGGLPALPLALERPDTQWLLVEAWRRRADTLRRTVRVLGLDSRVEVTADRAEDVGRGAYRGTADVVTARAFGPAAVTLECAAPLLRAGGVVICSVRDDDAPWPPAILAELGLGDVCDWRLARFRYRAARSRGTTDPRFPRRAGVPERRPLF